MMISPESYYEMNIKGKTTEQILSAIRGLKNEMGHLKNVMERPDYSTEIIIHPSEAVRLSCTREYHERAKIAYAETGGKYKPSKTELKAEDFQENVPYISKFTFGIGGFLGDYYKHVAMFEDGMLKVDVKHFGELIEMPQPLTEDLELYTWQSFLDAIEGLHIGEWLPHYSTKRFGYVVCDGTQWEVDIEYNNGHKPVRITGDNSFPYNFDLLQEIFGLDSED